MSDAALETLRDTLLAIPSEHVQSPDLPMAVVLQEGNDLLTLSRDPGVWDRLLAVGAQQADREALAQAIAATRAAQSQWTVARDRSKSSAQAEREERGYKLRLDLLDAGRWNLRNDRTALGTLSAIAEGEGVADLIQDLNDLALLIEQKAPAFANDKTFDVATRAEEARSLAAELAAGTSLERLDTNQARIVDLRNRAYTRLDGLVSSLREAGRYAFRDKDDVRKRFASSYVRRKNRRAVPAHVSAAPPPAAESGT
jgi:hypothetical protein